MYLHEQNLVDILMHSADASPSPIEASSLPLMPALMPDLQAHNPRRMHTTSVTTSPVSLRMLCVTFVIAVIAYTCTSERLEGDYGNVSASTPTAFRTNHVGFW